MFEDYLPSIIIFRLDNSFLWESNIYLRSFVLIFIKIYVIINKIMKK
jgi:hypothetical protein